MARVRAATHVYVASCKCGAGISGVTTDLGDKSTAKFVADFIKDGRAVERMTLAEYRERMNWCDCVNRPRTVQESLL